MKVKCYVVNVGKYFDCEGNLHGIEERHVYSGTEDYVGKADSVDFGKQSAYNYFIRQVQEKSGNNEVFAIEMQEIEVDLATGSVTTIGSHYEI